MLCWCLTVKCCTLQRQYYTWFPSWMLTIHTRCAVTTGGQLLTLPRTDCLHLQDQGLYAYRKAGTWKWMQFVPPKSRYKYALCLVQWNTEENIQGGSNMTGTNCDLFTHKSSRSYLNHLVYFTILIQSCIFRSGRFRCVCNSSFLLTNNTRWFKYDRDSLCANKS